MSAKATAMVGVAATIIAGGVAWANLPPPSLPSGAIADFLVVEKADHKLLAYSHGVLLRTYPVSLGAEPMGPKLRQGDRRTPEGRYYVDGHNPNSSFDRALHVSYPSAADLARARSAGYDPGGEIMIHGIHRGLGWIGRAHRLIDWTAGCIAVTDPEIEELYRIVPDGTPIELHP